MKIKIIFALLASLFTTCINAGTLVFEQSGYSIQSLDSPPPLAGVQPLQMLLPAVNGFSANVNVQIQPYNGTLSQYKDISDSQFKQYGFKPILSKINSNNVTFEYTGAMSGKNLHWYSKAYKKGDFIYLVTATEQESNWEKTKNKLMSVVDSFKLNKI